ncbi:tRNA modification GTPase MnmE [Planctomycetes bacterium MalM25]|nr:tRNA modification GTPase MnmE [Planctomycetes bacterium MalM25]
MKLATDDTIVAIATARGGADRGAVRLSGPDALSITATLAGEAIEANRPTRLTGQTLRLDLAGVEKRLPVALYVWPDRRSYTRQPSVEFHTVGSPPLLEAVVRAAVTAGARLAEPGEFTLRAFLAGRLDLTQAEAVLSVIDAEDEERLGSALERLAGGLSTPLHRLRAELLGLLADLEAGLDFVDEEDVRFVERDELINRLTAANRLVEETLAQLTERDASERLPRVAIVGPPNVGKSRLFNTLVARYGGEGENPSALVADQVGVTRDALAAKVRHAEVSWRLIDTAGDDGRAGIDAIDAVARGRLLSEHQEADLLLVCQRGDQSSTPTSSSEKAIRVITMSDLPDAPTPEGWFATSSATGEGIERLADAIARRLTEITSRTHEAHAAQRSHSGLVQALGALSRATAAAEADAGEELVSFELREALDGLGRVVGEVVTDEVLGEIFGKFCIGK